MSNTDRPGQKRWQFIDSSKDDGDNLTRVKRHVMQEYMRRKRLEAQRREGTTESSGDDEQKLQTKKRQRPRKTQPAKSSSATASGEIVRRTALKKESREETDEEAEDIVRFSLSKDASPLQTMLSAARTDPFDTLPLKLSPEDQHLFDFYVNEMPACSYGSHFRTKKAHNWYTEVFVPEAMKGALTFVNTILVHAANTWAWVHNQTETRSTLLHRQRAISMLRDHMTKFPHDISDNAITACMSAAALEDFDPRPERKEISWIHMRQARRMIRDRGGPAAFENTKLAMLINWQDYILAGYETDGPSFYYEHNPSFSRLASDVIPALRSSAAAASFVTSLPSPPNSTSSVSPGRTPSPCSRSAAVRHSSRFPLSPRQEVQLQCEEFIDFLNRCEQLAHRQRASLPKSSAPTRHSAFQEGCILHRILASPPGRRFTATGNRKQFIARLASSMMISAALWDYRSSIPRTEAFLQSLERRVLDSEVDMSGSVEALLQILLACKDGFPEDESGSSTPYIELQHDAPDFSQYSPTATSPFARPWFVGRMLKIAKRLSLESWMNVSSLLFSCLTLQIQGPPVMPSWESELRREILEAPLTSYVMRALQ